MLSQPLPRQLKRPPRFLLRSRLRHLHHRRAVNLRLLRLRRLLLLPPRKLNPPRPGLPQRNHRPPRNHRFQHRHRLIQLQRRHRLLQIRLPHPRPLRTRLPSRKQFHPRLSAARACAPVGRAPFPACTRVCCWSSIPATGSLDLIAAELPPTSTAEWVRSATTSSPGSRLAATPATTSSPSTASGTFCTATISGPATSTIALAALLRSPKVWLAAREWTPAAASSRPPTASLIKSATELTTAPRVVGKSACST